MVITLAGLGVTSDNIASVNCLLNRVATTVTISTENLFPDPVALGINLHEKDPGPGISFSLPPTCHNITVVSRFPNSTRFPLTEHLLPLLLGSLCQSSLHHVSGKKRGNQYKHQDNSPGSQEKLVPQR
jgi:hypothetical protein